MAEIVLKDKSGNPVIYEGILGLIVKTADGGSVSFGSGGWTPETLNINNGSFQPSSNEQTITHGLGAVPDFVFIGRLDVNDDVDRNRGHIAWALGFSSRMSEIEGFNLVPNWICIDEPDGESNVNYGKYMSTESIDVIHEYNYGMIREANSESFKVGDSDNSNICKGLLTTARYQWIAISGLGVRMNQSEV